MFRIVSVYIIRSLALYTQQWYRIRMEHPDPASKQLAKPV